MDVRGLWPRKGLLGGGGKRGMAKKNIIRRWMQKVMGMGLVGRKRSESGHANL